MSQHLMTVALTTHYSLSGYTVIKVKSRMVLNKETSVQNGNCTHERGPLEPSYMTAARLAFMTTLGPSWASLLILFDHLSV